MRQRVESRLQGRVNSQRAQCTLPGPRNCLAQNTRRTVSRWASASNLIPQRQLQPPVAYDIQPHRFPCLPPCPQDTHTHYCR
ncbi:hypothetical protein M3J09_005755 [Ascochyta lentis]